MIEDKDVWKWNALINKIIIVTGGGAGIGKALCLELSTRGAVALQPTYNERNAHQVAKEISVRSGKAQSMRVDVSVEEDTRKLIDDTVSKYGRIDICLIMCYRRRCPRFYHGAMEKDYGYQF